MNIDKGKWSLVKTRRVLVLVEHQTSFELSVWNWWCQWNVVQNVWIMCLMNGHVLKAGTHSTAMILCPAMRAARMAAGKTSDLGS